MLRLAAAGFIRSFPVVRGQVVSMPKSDRLCFIQARPANLDCAVAVAESL